MAVQISKSGCARLNCGVGQNLHWSPRSTQLLFLGLLRVPALLHVTLIAPPDHAMISRKQLGNPRDDLAKHSGKFHC